MSLQSAMSMMMESMKEHYRGELDKEKAGRLKAEAACAEMRQLIECVLRDPHQWSMRACATCREASELIGRPVGCYLYQSRAFRQFEKLNYRASDCGKGWLSPEDKAKVREVFIELAGWFQKAGCDRFRKAEQSDADKGVTMINEALALLDGKEKA